MRNRLEFSALLALTLAIPPARIGLGRPQGDALLTLRLRPVPATTEKIPLTGALRTVGSRTQGGYVLFGIELRLVENREPLVGLNGTCSTLGEALRQIFGQLPGYRYEVVSEHFIQVYPDGAQKDTTDALNTTVPSFDVVGEVPWQILAHPESYIPQLHARLRPGEPFLGPGGAFGGLGLGPRPPGLTITLHLRNVTVREILNAVAQAGENFPADFAPTGWLCTLQPSRSSSVGCAYSWSVLWSVPHDWRPEGKTPEKH